MKVSRREIEALLWANGLHGTMRSVHSATVGRQAAETRVTTRGFLRKLLTPDALVLDRGANAGVMEATFAPVGARVVAVEPNADCVRYIELSYRNKKIQVIQTAAGAWMEALQQKEEDIEVFDRDQSRSPC